MSGSRRATEVRKLLEREGWTFTITGGNHLRGTHPDAKGPIFLSCTAGSQRARVEAITTARRALREN